MSSRALISTKAMATMATQLCRVMNSRPMMEEAMRLPIPGMLKMTSITTAPPMSVPTLRPATVISVRLEGRSAWRQSTRMLLMPFDLAMRMKSSWRVWIMSLRSSRM